jgi:Domain of unknown function (DUF1844)
MSGESKTTANLQDATAGGIMPMRDLGFSILSLLVETAAGQLQLRVPLQPEGDFRPSQTVNLKEARAAIDAANALLEAIRHVMDSDARLAIESMLTQLQIDYVSRAGQPK